MNRSRSTALTLLVIAAALAWGLYRLFELRFAGGDVYPPYSTFRADPLGARALFEGFALLPDRQVQRLLEDLNRIQSGRDTTLFVLGAPAELDDIDESDVQDLERFMREGGRVVMTFFPETTKPYSAGWRERRSSTNSPFARIRRLGLRKPADPLDGPEKKTEEKSGKPGRAASGEGTNSVAARDQAMTNEPPARPRRADEEERAFGFRAVSLRAQWGFGVEYDKLAIDERGVAEPVTVERTNAAAALPLQLDWHSAAFFTPTNQAWRALYAREGRPVLMERALGRGSLVLASDSYFASNEALRKARHTALLAWLAGGNPRLIFDETHLGVESTPGIAMLARRYGLHGLFASLLLLALLFIWKNAAGFVPAYPDDGAASEIVSGKDSAAGFVNLLRRSIAPRALLALCFAEWQKTHTHRRNDPSGKLARMAAVVETQTDAPVDAYRELSRIASEKDL